jgi:hypothetical protein
MWISVFLGCVGKVDVSVRVGIASVDTAGPRRRPGWSGMCGQRVDQTLSVATRFTGLIGCLHNKDNNNKELLALTKVKVFWFGNCHHPRRSSRN